MGWLARRAFSRAALGVAAVAVLVPVWGLNVSRSGDIQGCLEGCGGASGRRQGPLRVMALNVLHGFPRFAHLAARLDHIAAEIRRHDPDLVLLQEVPWTLGLGDGARYLARRTGLHHVSARDNGNRWVLLFESRVAILSRYPLSTPRLTELAPRAGFFEHRVVLEARADTPWGPLQAFTTHLTPRDPDLNRRQIESLRSLVARSGARLAVVGGDLNALPGSPQIRALAAGWVDTFAAANPGLEGFTCCVDDLAAPPDEPLEMRLDYLFLVAHPEAEAEVRGSWRVLTEPFPWQGGWRWASDHVGLMAEIALAQGRGAPDA